MIIGACGYGGTGSSAVKDYIKEFRNVQTLDRAESQFAFKVDGLQDLHYHLCERNSRELNGDIAIKRFREAALYAKVPFVKKTYLNSKQYVRDTEDFLQSLVQTEYCGLENFDYENVSKWHAILVLAFKKIIIKQYERITGKLYKGWPMRTISVCIDPDEFYEKARSYMRKLIINGGGDYSKIILLDQPFEGNAPEQSFPFYDDPYAIVVDRDPRDLYMASSYQWPDGMFMPRRDVKAFVHYYRNQRKNVNVHGSNNRILRVSLESMIFDYEITTARIKDFLGFSESDHIYPKKYFEPKRSIKGSQIYKKIPGHEEEIYYIEKELKEYLFDFDKYELSKSNNMLNKGFGWDKEV